MLLPTPDQFAQRLSAIEQRVNELKKPGQIVEIIAVTKAQDPQAVQLAFQAGLPIGENYAQELLIKRSLIEQLIEQSRDSAKSPVHFIGQLQTNKVRQIADLVDVFETVDRQSLVEEIAKRKPGATIYVQVNATEDENRGGCSWADAERVVASAREHLLEVRGLMTVGIADNDAATRDAFAQLGATAKSLELVDLSMGMSQDWEIAVAEGATKIRLGRALFGARN